jgi:metal-responsive CopG/Arc/MetJ family transcriptional regulator
MQTISVELPDALIADFDRVCLENNKIRQSVLQELMTRYLEDIEDAAIAEYVLSLDEPTIPIEKLRTELGLEN